MHTGGDLVVLDPSRRFSVKRSLWLGGLSMIGLLVLADSSAAQRRC
jgi:hypothetical protein